MTNRTVTSAHLEHTRGILLRVLEAINNGSTAGVKFNLCTAINLLEIDMETLKEQETAQEED